MEVEKERYWLVFNVRAHLSELSQRIRTYKVELKTGPNISSIDVRYSSNAQRRTQTRACRVIYQRIGTWYGIKSHCGREDKSGMLFVDNEENEARRVRMFVRACT